MHLPNDINPYRPEPIELWVEVTKGENRGRRGLISDRSIISDNKRGICYVGGNNIRGKVNTDRVRYLDDAEVAALEQEMPSEVARAREINKPYLLWGRMPMPDGTFVRCYIQPSPHIRGEWTLHDNGSNAVLRTYGGHLEMGDDIYTNLIFDHAWAKMQDSQ